MVFFLVLSVVFSSFLFSNCVLFSHVLTSIFFSLFCLLFSCYWLPLSIPMNLWSFGHILQNSDMTHTVIWHLNTGPVSSRLYTSAWKVRRFLKLKMLNPVFMLSLSESQKWRNVKTSSSLYFPSGLTAFDFIQEPKNYHSRAFIYSLTIINASSYTFPSRVPSLHSELLFSCALLQVKSHDHSLIGGPLLSIFFIA